MNSRFGRALAFAAWLGTQTCAMADDLMLETLSPFEGGGTSTSSGITVEGSFGSGGDWLAGGEGFVLEPGAWVMRAGVRLPELRIEASERGVLIRWPGESPGWELEFSDSPGLEGWRTLPPPYQADEQGFYAQITPDRAARFYRLRRAGFP